MFLCTAAFKIHENHCSVDFWIQGQKIIKSSFMVLVLSISGAHARKSSNGASSDWCFRCPERRLESLQIEFPGTGFADFLQQGWKVIKSGFLGSPGISFDDGKSWPTRYWQLGEVPVARYLG